jgi:hypothetical protein
MRTAPLLLIIINRLVSANQGVEIKGSGNQGVVVVENEIIEINVTNPSMELGTSPAIHGWSFSQALLRS